MNKSAMQLLLMDYMKKYKGLPYPKLNEPVPAGRGPGDDYTVVYEAVIETGSTDILMMELWLTDTGYIAVGIETRDRIARRLGLKTPRRGFAAGHEPREITESALRELLNSAANGEISIGFTKLFGTLCSTRALISIDTRRALMESGYVAMSSFDCLPGGSGESLPWSLLFFAVSFGTIHGRILTSTISVNLRWPRPQRLPGHVVIGLASRA